MKYGSVCSGIEAATVAWHPLGWTPAWFSEIEPFPSAVLAHHYPTVPNLGDMTALPARIIAGEVEAPDLLCGGTPCQAFSVAGLRQSLDDARGNLSLTFCEIANAIDAVRRAAGAAPAVIFWENVPGVLNTKDNAFGCFLAGLAGESGAIQPAGAKWTNAGAVYGPARAVAWRVLDAQYFGVAQRRRRVFVVASARDGFDPAAVLFEFDGVRRDIAPRRQTREAVAPPIAGCSNHGGANGPGRDVDSVESLVCMSSDQANAEVRTDAIAHTLRGSGFDASEDDTGRGTPLVPVAFQPGNLKRGVGSAPNTEVFPTLAANQGRGASDQDPHVVVAFDTTQITSPSNCSNLQPGDPCHPLAAGAHAPAIAFHPTQDQISSEYGTTHAMGCGSKNGCAGQDLNHGHSHLVFQPFEVANCLTQRMHKGINTTVDEGQTPILSNDPAHAICANEQRTYTNEGSVFQLRNVVGQPIPFDTSEDDLAPNLTSTDRHGVFSPVVAPALTASNNPSRSPQSSEVTAQVMAVMQATAEAHITYSTPAIGDIRNDNIASCISRNTGGGGETQNPAFIQSRMQVRRLTPVECERLQGFPDGYTNVPWRGKPEAPDGPRYKALGNSWAVPNVRWIGKRIQGALK